MTVSRLENEERDLFTTKGNMSYVWYFVWTCETDLPRLVSRVVNIWLYRNNKLELEIKLSLPFPNLYRYLLTPYYTWKAPMIGQSYQRKINWTEFISLPQLFHVICSWLPKRSWRNPRMIPFRRKAKTNGYLEPCTPKWKSQSSWTQWLSVFLWGWCSNKKGGEGKRLWFIR